jgi:ergothioneine biosynthesis protein EgtB
MTDTRSAIDVPVDQAALLERLAGTRNLTEQLAAPLAAEDQVVQSMPDVSPTKWHRAHTTWFFETFVLGPYAPGYEPVHEAYDYLFNSYYEQVGPRHPRSERGLISRPTVAEVGDYRAAVDERLGAFLSAADPETWAVVAPLVELGVNHEQQHQELLLMDIKHVLSRNPLRPAYVPEHRSTPVGSAGRPTWIEIEPGGVVEIGHDGRGFSFDSEGPRHRTYLEPFRIADRLVTCGEWADFIADGGYRRPDLWLSDGWYAVEREGWTAPLYWMREGEGWHVHTLAGTRPIVDAEPVAHVSYYEADAYARWAGKRLPTEFEWEHAVATTALADPRPFSLDQLHPRPAEGPAGVLDQTFGECWQWTASSYLPYPGFVPAPGAVGEYNGKFMSGQMVLRGSSAFTPPAHARSTYRNFFPPHARWMLSGVRLADGGTP